MNEFSKRRFDNIDTATVSISDYKEVGEGVAEVLVSTTGKMKPMEIVTKLIAKLGGAATPIHGSFRELAGRPGTLVGFVSGAQPPRLIDSEAELASYRHVSANMYLDSNDESLWELKTGAAGKYLARKGSDELPEVLASVRKPRSSGIPALSSVQRPAPEKTEFVAFVDRKNEVNYGFAIGKDKAGNVAVVTSASQGEATPVNPALVIETAAVQLPPHSKMPVLSGVPDAADMIAYYRKAYFYNAAYLAEVIRTINEQAAA